MTAALTAEVVELLAERYPTRTSARALWAWAGGREEELPWDEEPGLPLWSELWRLAGDEAATAARREALVREALFDTPGDPLLLDHLAERAASVPERPAETEMTLAMIERLRPFGFPVTWLAPLLERLPPPWEESFAALAPAVDEWLGPRDRERLAQAADRAAELHATVGALHELRLALRDEEGDAEERELLGEEARRVQEVLRSGDEQGALALALEHLRSLRARAEGWPRAAGTDPAAERLAAGLRRLVMRLEFRKRPRLSSTAAGLTSLLVGLGLKGGEDPPPLLDERADALRWALWATLPAEDEDEVELDEEDAPPA
ncbi:MAG: hypothetical protein D6731_04775 [Planctomycetota bacterium]|nr:MAG: hypothetical protein D6731_04775 [Planctomycetota bacterium]